MGLLPAEGRPLRQGGQLHEPPHQLLRLRRPPGGGIRHGGRQAADCLAETGDVHERPRGREESAHRPRAGAGAHHTGALPPRQEQPAARRRAGRGQDGPRMGTGAPHQGRQRAQATEGQPRLPARHGHAAGRHPVSRRLREPHQDDHGRHQRRGPEQRGLHRRDPHARRSRSHRRRLDGRLEHAEALSRGGQPALHRLDHLRGV